MRSSSCFRRLSSRRRCLSASAMASRSASRRRSSSARRYWRFRNLPYVFYMTSFGAGLFTCVCIHLCLVDIAHLLAYSKYSSCSCPCSASCSAMCGGRTAASVARRLEWWSSSARLRTRRSWVSLYMSGSDNDCSTMIVPTLISLVCLLVNANPQHVHPNMWCTYLASRCISAVDPWSMRRAS